MKNQTPDNRMIENQALDVNTQEKRNTIIRVVHNRENPFVQLNKQSLWDSSLSLKAVGLWARCMSRPDNWTFSIKEFVNHCKEGRKVIDSAMQELLENNYAVRLEYIGKNARGKFDDKVIEYVFFEFQATEEEKEIQMALFKKSFRDCRFGNFRFGDFQKEHLLIYNTKEIESSSLESLKEKEAPIVPQPKVEAKASPEEPKAKKEFSPEVQEVSQKLLQITVEESPSYLIPKNLNPFIREVDGMTRIDKREPNKLYEVLRFILNDPFYGPGLLNGNLAKKLREKYATFEHKMKAKPVENSFKIDRREKDKNGKPMKDEQYDNLF